MKLPGAIGGNRIKANLFAVAGKARVQIAARIARQVFAHLLSAEVVAFAGCRVKEEQLSGWLRSDTIQLVSGE